MLNFEVETFLDDLNKQPCTLVYSFDDPDESYSLCLYLFTSVPDKHAPLKRKRVKKPRQPNSFNSDILRAIHQRNHFH